METSEQRKLCNRLLELAAGGAHAALPGMYLVIPVGDVSVSKTNRGKTSRGGRIYFKNEKKKSSVLAACATDLRALVKGKMRGSVNQSLSFPSSYCSTLYCAAFSSLNDILQRDNNNNNYNNSNNNNNFRVEADHLAAAFAFQSP